MLVRHSEKILCALAIMLLGATSWAAAPKRTRVTSPGGSKDLSWRSTDINGCRKAGRPILLYIFDSNFGKKTNHTALYVENSVFPHKDVLAALSGYSCVMLSSTNARGWPKAFISRARGGAAVYLMTCDGRPYGTWTGRQRPKAKRFAILAKQVAQANPAAKARMAKNPPKKYEDPPEPKAPGQKEEEVRELEEKKPVTAGRLPGMGGGKDDDKDGKKPSRPKRPKVEEPEEEEEE